jgi:asparagine synthase (glutamine-hydrolysing)
MSGIVGLLSFDAAPVERSQLERMTGFLSYCGPDRQHMWLDGRIGLGNTLLGTTRESARDPQPCSLDGQVWITADARVDGRAELIHRLQGYGRHLATDTPDVELILHAYHVWGEAALDHLIGDFAFAIWDGRRQSLFCARDQFGVIPLYYAKVGNGLAISNVLDCLRLHPAVSDELNEHAIGDFLLFSMNADAATTTFADIHTLPPAHALTLADGVLRIRRYWDPPEPGAYVRRERPQEYVERFGAVLDQAVGDRLRSDSVGAYLSGGMDSTSITVTAHKLLKARGHSFDLRAYTVVYEHLIDEEEGRYADQVAAMLDIPVEHLVADEYLTRAPDATPEWVFPEPTLIPNQRAEYEIARRIATFSRVQLSGLGGDPLFHGPSGWAAGYARGRWRDLPHSLWLSLFRYRTLPRFGARTALRKRLRGGSEPPELPDWIDPEFARRVDLMARRQQVIADAEAPAGPRRMLVPLWANLFAWGHPGAHGLPLKTLFPFFDLRLMRFVMETPPFPWRQSKRLLREAMRGQLPEAVRLRPKKLLYVPAAGADTNDPWYKLALRPESRGWRRELVSTPAMARFIDVERTLALIDSPVPVRTRPALDVCFPLAEWLRHQGRPAADLRRTKEVRHVPDATAA